MWWLFERLDYNGKTYEYAYSRENKALDGILRYSTETGETSVVRPCAGDEESEWSQSTAAEKFYWVIEDRFPERKMVACG